MDEQQTETVNIAVAIEDEKYTKFLTERVEQCTTSDTRTLPKNNMSLFRKPLIGIKSTQNTDCKTEQ